MIIIFEQHFWTRNFFQHKIHWTNFNRVIHIYERLQDDQNFWTQHILDSRFFRPNFFRIKNLMDTQILLTHNLFWTQKKFGRKNQIQRIL